MEIRIFVAYALIALLVAGAIATASYVRYNSREAVERRQRKKSRELYRKRQEN